MHSIYNHREVDRIQGLSGIYHGSLRDHTLPTPRWCNLELSHCRPHVALPQTPLPNTAPKPELCQIIDLKSGPPIWALTFGWGLKYGPFFCAGR